MKGKYKVLRDFYGLLMVSPRRKWLFMDGISFFLRELFRNGSYSYRVFNQYTFYTGCGDMCTMTHFKRLKANGPTVPAIHKLFNPSIRFCTNLKETTIQSVQLYIYSDKVAANEEMGPNLTMFY